MASTLWLPLLDLLSSHACNSLDDRALLISCRRGGTYRLLLEGEVGKEETFYEQPAEGEGQENWARHLDVLVKLREKLTNLMPP